MKAGKSNYILFPTTSGVIGALATAWHFMNVKGCSLSCSDSFDNVEKRVLFKAARLFKQKIQEYFTRK